MIPKVLAYITRERCGDLQLLVFRHREHPEAGVQIPSGTVEPGEELLAAALREVREETGLEQLRFIAKLASELYYEDLRKEWHQRNVFWLSASGDTPDEWTHNVAGKGDDCGLLFDVYWLPAPEARQALCWGHGGWIDLLVNSTGPTGSDKIADEA